MLKRLLIAAIFSIAASAPALPQGAQLGPNQFFANPTASKAQPKPTTLPACANDGIHALVYINGTGLQCATMTVGGVVPTGYIGGLTISNDGASPNTIIDIAAGMAADSTNSVLISLGAMIKATTGAWQAGNANGMGNGLTIAASTWYHVCLTPNGGSPDLWFDTSAVCANKPSGVSGSLFRRIASFKTNGSSAIIAFLQIKDAFYWQTPVLDVNAFAVTSTPANKSFTVPLGVSVRPIMNLNANSSGSLSTSRFRIYSPLLGDNNVNTDVSCGASTAATAVTAVAAWCSDSNEYTDTSQNLRIVNNGNESNVAVNVFTMGWIDNRGQ